MAAGGWGSSAVASVAGGRGTVHSLEDVVSHGVRAHAKLRDHRVHRLRHLPPSHLSVWWHHLPPTTTATFNIQRCCLPMHHTDKCSLSLYYSQA